MNHHSQSATHLLGLVLLCHNLHLSSVLLIPLQPGQQLLAHLHRRSQLAAHLVSLLGQRCAEYGSGGLGPLPLLQGQVQPVDLPVLLVVRLPPDALQLQILLPEQGIQPLDLLEEEGEIN